MSARRLRSCSLALLASVAPSVQAMVVGRGGVLSAAAPVRASATSVRVAGRRCAVGAATPLAVLLVAARARRLAVGLRDYGHCGAAAVNSAQLFVDALGGERNAGQDGWVYKVGNLGGTTGAADLSGPQGDGRRLARGQRVLWFWCFAGAGGCQRTLAVSLSSSSPEPAGAALRVSVRGYDDFGRGTPIVGATVTLGLGAGAGAVTGAGGTATLSSPLTPGRYTLNASKAGFVPSFPETLVVQ